jgi:hypothetical protein
LSTLSPNLRPFPKGVSGNPGGRPKKKQVTEELERLLAEEAPNGNGQTWATVIAQALLRRASKGDVRAIAELANRIEGKPAQAVAVDVKAGEGLAAALERARKRVLQGMTAEEIKEKIRQLEAELGSKNS